MQMVKNVARSFRRTSFAPPPLLTALVFLIRGFVPIQSPSKNLRLVRVSEMNSSSMTEQETKNPNVSIIDMQKNDKLQSIFSTNSPTTLTISPINNSVESISDKKDVDTMKKDFSHLENKRTEHIFIDADGEKMEYQLYLPKISTLPLLSENSKELDSKKSLEETESKKEFSSKTSSRSLMPVILFLHGAGDGPYNVMNSQSLPRLLGEKCWELNFIPPGQEQKMKWNIDECNFFKNSTTYPFVTIMPNSGLPSRWTEFIIQKRTIALLTYVIEEQIGINYIDYNRIILIGQSAGGRGALEFAANFPDKFSAVIPICFAGISNSALQEWTTNDNKSSEVLLSKSLLSIPIWLIHAVDDSVVPIDMTSQDLFNKLKKIRSISLGPLEYGDERVSEFRFPSPITIYSNSKESISNKKTSSAEVIFSRYSHAPGPPIEEYAYMIGHASYDIAFRDKVLYQWMKKKVRKRKIAKSKVLYR